MTGSSPVESQQRVVSEALASLDALRPLLANGAIEAALRRAHDWKLEAKAASEGGPRGVGGHSDPTFSAVARMEQYCNNESCLRVDASGEKQRQRAKVTPGRATCPRCGSVWVVPIWAGNEGKAFAMLTSALETIAKAGKDATDWEVDLRPVKDSAAYQKHLALTGTEANRARDCAQDSCPDPAITGSPHCAACAAYLAARPGIACVPSEVLEAREKKRTQRKAKGVHVTGPLAEQEAS